jgi:hypothetical protein
MRNERGGSASLLVRRLLILPILLAGLAACGSTGSGGDSDSGFSFGSMFGSSSTASADARTDQVQAAKATTVRAESCPQIEILAGTRAYRVFEKGLEEQALGLRYQAAIAETARECSMLGAETAMRIGIQGRVLVGPKGGPGKIDVPLRIAVVDENNQPVYSKAYRIPVEIPAGQTQVSFAHVEEGVLVPAGPGGFRVVVGFDENAAKTAAPARRS